MLPLISHESPLCLLNESLEYNDYQYILPYFYYRNEEYKKFMLDYRGEQDSFIILDNGLFEGETYTIQELIELVNETKPNIFIIPDEWNDSTKTHVNAKYWMGLKKSEVLPRNTEIMVVLQGKSFSEIKQLYRQCIDLGYKYFSFNHSSIAYDTPKGYDKSMRRFELVNECVDEGIIKNNHYIHLLGAININEFMYYSKYLPGVINSLDTSSPILNGCHKEIYDFKNSQRKPKGKIEDFFYKDLDSEQINCILKNIKTFKQGIYEQ